jgi:hypothetical protein
MDGWKEILETQQFEAINFISNSKMGNQSEFWESPRRNVTKLSSSDFTLLN